MQVDTASSQFALDQQGLQRLKHSAREERPEALRAAAQQFEALFLHSLIKGMRATIPTSDLTNSKQTEFYQSLLDHQWAQTMAERGIGLADSLVEQLESGYQQPSADQRQPSTDQQQTPTAVAADHSEPLLAGIPRGEPRLLTTIQARSVPAAAATTAAAQTDSSQAGSPQRSPIQAGLGLAGIEQAGPVPSADAQGLFVAQRSPPGGLFASMAEHSGQAKGDQTKADQQVGGLGAIWSDAASGGLASTDDWAPSPGGLLAALSGPIAPDSAGLSRMNARDGDDDGHGRAGHMQAFLTPLVAPAQAASRRTGLPAELILAQAALETGWGRHQIHTADGRNSHNLFGIKAGSRWQGPTAQVTTHEYLDGERTRIKDRFRVYESYEAAFTDYGRLLSNSPRYAAVSRAPTAEQAARELQAGGYATDPAYADKLIKIMGSFGTLVAEAPRSPLIQGN